MRQYIGARYVPKFMGTYDPTQVYEALCVVDNGMGTSYISKIPTPANTPLTDSTYWQLYGASSGAIIHLQDQIDDIHDELDTGSLVVENVDTDTKPAAEVINVAGQGSSDQRGVVIHNYTDADALRIDHVGQNVIMDLVNAHNSVKRPDKASTFHGDAEYIRFMVQVDPDGDDNWSQEVIGNIDENGDIFRSGYDNTGNSARNHTFHIATNKLEGGTWAFNIEAYNQHPNYMILRNGGNTIGIIKPNGTKGIKIMGGDQNTDGAIFGDSAGNLVCLNDGVQINLSGTNTFRVNAGGTLKQVEYGNNLCTSSTRPTTGLYNGLQYKETDTHKIIWYLNGTWYDAMGNAV